MFSLPWLELSRFRRHTITRLAMVVIIVIPAIYAGLYLASNWNPTGNLDKLQAAVVNLDRGADSPTDDDERVEAGDELVDNITGNSDSGFNWHETSLAEANQGLADGRYFAILEIPANFSSSIVSTGGDDPQQADLTLRSDDAHSFIVGQLSGTVLREIADALDATVTADYVSQVYVGFNTIHDSVAEAADGAAQVSDGADQLAAGAVQLDDGATQLDEGTTTLVDGLVELDDGARQLDTGAAELSSGAGELSTGISTARSGSETLADGAAQVADGTATLAATADTATARANEVKDRADELVANAQPQLEQAGDDFDQAADRIDERLADRIAQLREDYPDDENVAQLANELTAVQDDLGTARTRADAAAAQAQNLQQRLASASDQVISQVNEADAQIDRLNDGAQQVSTGADTLASGMVTLDTGGRQLVDGAATLSTGTGQLVEGTGTALSGARELSTGAGQLAEGTGEAVDGSQELADGASELAERLSAGLEDIPTYSADDREERSSVVATPIDAQQDRMNEVSVYGEGLAPFFITLSLWIGGMITFMVINAIPYRALASTTGSGRVAWAGYVPGALFGIGQVIVLYGVLVFALDFTAGVWLGTIAFSILIAVSFHAIHQLCIAALGGVGRLVALVLLMVQIGAAGGTYPVETAPAFFQAISPWLPMTHGVSGLRALIAGGDLATVWQSVGALVLTMVLALAATTLVCARKRTVSMTRLHPSLSL
ncbi:YhgE/Pip domain-containing protein [Naumannella halotolerans]|uniref:Putative membrane protein n=1 Tax=Naumannella halotolerans TaxID=993414 RepID=A0A4R7JBI2_9ACTN|nr:YhgE/Pip domain-containing protein [Naumannella halotolerans]TDT34336.1 putative membrane protein [Naumannella halotolerans]